MATKIDLAVAAIIALRQQGSEPTFAAVQKLVKTKGGEDISEPTYYQARRKIETMTETPASVPPPPERVLVPAAEPAQPPTSPRLPVDRFLLAVEAARTLLQAVDNDKEAAAKIINSL